MLTKPPTADLRHPSRVRPGALRRGTGIACLLAWALALGLALPACAGDDDAGGPCAHGHYINMTNPAYTKVACGFYTTPGGAVWAVQNFSR